MSSINKEYTAKKEGIAESRRWRNVVMEEEQKLKTPLTLLPPDFLKKECVTVYPDSKYFVRSSYIYTN